MKRLSVFRRAGQGAFFQTISAVVPLILSFGCASADPDPAADARVATASEALDAVGICNQDPRVNIGLVPLAVCAGARVFFDETFNGNGRTCGSCHPAANNFTIDQRFTSTLAPDNPLFVGDNPAFNLSTLETPALKTIEALVRENVDGFEDVAHKFVSRAVSHTLSLATSLERDPNDGTSAAVVQRTGWGGDGAPGDGSLRSFLDGAIQQHYPTSDVRTPGVHFRFATNAEKDQVLAFQLALGRTNELNLNAVTLADPVATEGKAAFLDPLRGRCNECHSNAGARALVGGKNRNFNTGTFLAPTSGVSLGSFPNGRAMFDGGFGGANQTNPNLHTVSTDGLPDAFGDGSFSTPPLIEAADTGPFFHTHAFGQAFDPRQTIESGVSFYATSLFLDSPAAAELDARFGGQPANVGPFIGQIGRFLRVLNVSFNLAIAKQRMDASRTLNIAFWGYRDDIQKGLLNLASEEIEDALKVLEFGSNLHPNEQPVLVSARALLAEAVATTNPAVRKSKTEAATTLVVSVRNALGTGMNFTLGAGNLMF
jgi:hypothetical protein